MVPKLHAKGSSFKGAAAYLLHDKDRAKTNERVAWTEVRNLATENPHAAWKVMAATAMDQNRLKEQAGVKKTGRKSFDAVLHFTLSWHPEEKEGLTRAEMTKAAHQAIRALNASDRQAMIVCHDDEPHPHIHVLLNRISSEDGRMLSSSKEKLALSAWAEAYEKERGFVYCEDRVLNNAARKRGEYTRGEKDQARNIFEAVAANDNAPDAKKLRELQKRKDAELARKARANKERQRKQWAELEQAHKARIKEIKAEAARSIAASKDAIRLKRRPDWTMLYHEHEIAKREFERREETLKGKITNFFNAIDFKAIIRGREDMSRKQAIGQVFDASDAGKRLEILKRQQEAEKRGVALSQKRQEMESERELREARDVLLQENRIAFDRQRNDAILIQSLEGAKLRTERKTRNEQKREAWESAKSSGRAREALPRMQTPEFVRNEAPLQEMPEQQGQPERPTHAPEVISEDVARQMEIRRLKERFKQRSRDHDRDR